MASVVFAELHLGLAVPQVEQRHAQRRVPEEIQMIHSTVMRCGCRDLKGLAATVGPSGDSRAAVPPAPLRLRQELRT